MITTPQPARPESLKFSTAPQPLDQESRRKLARGFHTEGKRQQAAEIYAQILKANPHDRESLEYLAQHYIEGGVYNHAASLFNALLAANPQHKSARYHLSALQALADKTKSLPKYLEFYERLLGDEDRSGPGVSAGKTLPY